MDHPQIGILRNDGERTVARIFPEGLNQIEPCFLNTAVVARRGSGEAVADQLAVRIRGGIAPEISVPQSIEINLLFVIFASSPSTVEYEWTGEVPPSAWTIVLGLAKEVAVATGHEKRVSDQTNILHDFKIRIYLAARSGTGFARGGVRRVFHFRT